ncbi:hypothetical protein [Streptomyces sp. NBC_00212]
MGVLRSRVGGEVLRFSPALNITEDALGHGLDVIEAVLRGR